MALTYSKHFFSESTNGRMIGLTATSRPGDLIHTVGVTGTGEYEIIHLWGVNTSTDSDVGVVIDFGGSATLGREKVVQAMVTVNAAPTQIISKLMLTATTSNITALAFKAAATGVFANIGGYVIRAT